MKRNWCPRCHQLMVLSAPLRGLFLVSCTNRTCKLPSIPYGSHAFQSLLDGTLSKNPTAENLVIQSKEEVASNG